MGADRKHSSGPSSDTTRGFVAGAVTATIVVLLIGRFTGSGTTSVPSAATPATAALAAVAKPAKAVAALKDVAAAPAASSCGVCTIKVRNPEGNPLWELFKAHERGPLMRKWSQYFPVYDRYFQQFRGKTLNFLEIGVQSGGTIEMWHTYFGPGLTMYGIDINPYCKELFNDPPRTNIYVGDQSDREGWARFRKEMAEKGVSFDVILDDGGHTMEQQITTWEEAWPLLNLGGVYICEDTATSMDVGSSKWGGGYKRDGTWIEYAKNFVDLLNGHYVTKGKHPGFDRFNRTTEIVGTAFYDQMVVLEKAPHPKPDSVAAGNFRISIVGKLKDGKINQSVLASYRKQMKAALEGTGGTAERQ